MDHLRPISVRTIRFVTSCPECGIHAHHHLDRAEIVGLITKGEPLLLDCLDCDSTFTISEEGRAILQVLVE